MIIAPLLCSLNYLCLSVFLHSGHHILIISLKFSLPSDNEFLQGYDLIFFVDFRAWHIGGAQIFIEWINYWTHLDTHCTTLGRVLLMFLKTLFGSGFYTHGKICIVFEIKLVET